MKKLLPLTIMCPLLLASSLARNRLCAAIVPQLSLKFYYERQFILIY